MTSTKFAIRNKDDIVALLKNVMTGEPKSGKLEGGAVVGPQIELNSEPDDDVIDISPQPKSTSPGGHPLANKLNLHVLNTWHPGQAIHDT